MLETGWEQLQEVRLRSDLGSEKWIRFLVLLVIAFFAVTIFFRGNVELTFSFLLVLRLSLHAVYYTKNETSEHWLFLDARPLTHFTSLDAGSHLEDPQDLKKGPTLHYVCRRVYIFK